MWNDYMKRNKNDCMINMQGSHSPLIPWKTLEFENGYKNPGNILEFWSETLEKPLNLVGDYIKIQFDMKNVKIVNGSRKKRIEILILKWSLNLVRIPLKKPWNTFEFHFAEHVGTMGHCKC